MNIINHAKEVISSVRQKSDRAILFYSGGKDSIVLLDMMAKEFTEVVLVFMYFVKGLEHVDKYIRFANSHYPNVRTIQVPHWNLTYILKSGMYCTPRPSQKLMKLKDVDESIRLQTGINYSFFGMKKADSLHRRVMLMTYDNEAINWDTGKVYPLSLWKNGDVLRYIRDNRLPEPVQYGKKTSNGVGFNIDCFLYLRNNYPQDLKKIFKSFPLSEQILYEYDANRLKKESVKSDHMVLSGDRPLPNRLRKAGQEARA